MKIFSFATISNINTENYPATCLIKELDTGENDP